MIFRQLFDADSSTYTYILGCEQSREAIVIDPVFERHVRDSALLRELNLSVKYTLDTHVHADHVTGAWLMRDAYKAQIGLCGEYHASGVDIELADGDVLGFGEHCVTAWATPGHTNGCMTYVTNDKAMAFTGDSLMIRGAGRTDFQSGDVHVLWQSIREKLFSLPDDCLVYPGHDYMGRSVSTIGEERRYNPRIGGEAKEEDFVGYMNNLGLPHPKLLDIALPANLESGKPDENANASPASWGPVAITFAGIPEIEPDWVARHLTEVTLLDVRDAVEYEGEHGHIRNAVLIPLNELRERLTELDDTKPIVAICQSGKRSAMATQILKQAGLNRVANLPGGLIHWSRLALPGLVGDEI